MRILFIGDVVGAAGVVALKASLPGLVARWNVDLTIVNGENSAESGFGITRDTYRAIRDAGADVVTLGNHSWNHKDALELVDEEPCLLRPLNYVPDAPGAGFVELVAKSGRRVLVANAMGRLFMEPSDDPFGAVDRLLQSRQLGREFGAIVIDFHCEAAGEKQAMGQFCDGRVSLLVGTHTHTPSADHRILSGGTAYITDAGMTGDYNSVVGMDYVEPLERFRTGVSSRRFAPASGAATICGIAVETNETTGLAVRIAPLRMGPLLEERTPTHWE